MRHIPRILVGIQIENGRDYNTYTTLFEMVYPPYGNGSMREFVGTITDFAQNLDEILPLLADAFTQTPIFARTTKYAVLNGGYSFTDESCSAQSKKPYTPIPAHLLFHLMNLFKEKNSHLEPSLYVYNSLAKCYFPCKI
ncbi:hypothetical protein HYV86_07510 [Candidatus Woesearchaeota archaeon]|nr:hypothetical protein [Candidatus Woesearchaeota archaeon]